MKNRMLLFKAIVKCFGGAKIKLKKAFTDEKDGIVSSVKVVF